jgi:hypothetical protein
MEHVAAAQLAAGAGAPLACIDAPLPAQEGWVRALLAEFATRQAGAERAPAPYELMRDAAALASRLPPGAAEWDEALARAFVGLGPPAIRAFKLARAAAAAAVAPADAPPALARLRRLQPLKWAHFARREAHMAWRLRELCEELAREAGGGSSGGGGADAAAAPGQQQQQGGSGGGEAGGGAAARRPTMLAVVGRQHALALRALWEDRGSRLWRDELPREFSPSVIDDWAARTAAAEEVRAGGPQ